MKLFLLLIVLFLQNVNSIAASPSKDVEHIDLNLNDHEIAVTFFGLSNGEATLIQGANRENILVDAGGGGKENELEGWLSLYGVKEISSLFLTSIQSLHYDQINQLVSKYRIREIVAPPQLSTQLMNHLNISSQTTIKSWVEGRKNMILPELTAEVQFVGAEKDEGMDFTLQFFKHRLFLMASSSYRAEQRLLHKNLAGVNVFKVPNGAKENSLSERFIEYMNPQISVVYAAKAYQPDPDIVHNLHDVWSEVYFPKKHGTVTIKFTETNYEVFTIPLESHE